MSTLTVKNTFSALQYPNYRLWFGGQLVSLVGSWMQSTAQGYLVYELTGSEAYLGIVTFASGLPTIIFSLYGGVIADRLPRRLLLIITQGSMMVLALMLAALNFLHVIQPWHIVVMAFLLGIANAFDAPARLTLPSVLVDKKDLTNAIALNSGMFNLALIVGPSVAGITYAALGPAWCFTINGLSFVAVIVALLLMKLAPQIAPVHRGNALSDIGEGLRFSFSHPIIPMLLINIAAVSIFGFGMVTLLPAWSDTVLHGDVKTYGALLSARGIGSLIGSLTVAALGGHNVRGKLITIGGFVMPIALALFAFTRNINISLLLIMALGWALIAIVNSINATIQTAAPDAIRGRVMSIYSLVFMGSTPIGGLMAGAFAEWIGAPLTAIISAGILFSVSLFYFFFRPVIWRLE
ncbi:MAG TPA: MFS transporter [Longilinea sp.]|nr:MFS transporter [Longilinea sp.]